jgi:MATE family multidrug resistance protein
MNLSKAVKSILKLSIPIIIGQLGQMLIVAGDVYIATMYSTKSVASIGVAGGIINPVFLFGIGLMMGVSPSLATMRGEGADEKKSLTSIIIYSAVVGVVLTFIMLIINEFVYVFGVKEELIPSIKQYISIVAWSFPFAIIFQGMKEYLQSFEKVFLPNLLAISAVIINLGLNYLFVFGTDGIPGMGEVGLAYASLSIRIILCLSLFVYVMMNYSFTKVCLELIKKVFKFSLPIAFMFFLEVLAFCMVSVVSGGIGVIEAATNNIIMTIASISFMIPLSISSAVAVKVGHGHGLKDKPIILAHIEASIIAAMAYICIAVFTFLVFPVNIMNFMTNDLEVISLGVKLLFIVAIFQFSDTLQVILSGILRGLDDTTTSSYMVFIGYWVIGIPTGLYLAFKMDYGTEGLWSGLAISLSLVALALSVVTFRKYKSIKD